MRIETIGQLGRVAPERAPKVAVSTLESGHHVVEGLLRLVLVQGQDAGHDLGGPRLLVLEALLSGHEQAGDHP